MWCAYQLTEDAGEGTVEAVGYSIETLQEACLAPSKMLRFTDYKH